MDNVSQPQNASLNVKETCIVSLNVTNSCRYGLLFSIHLNSRKEFMQSLKISLNPSINLRYFGVNKRKEKFIFRTGPLKIF